MAVQPALDIGQSSIILRSETFGLSNQKGPLWLRNEATYKDSRYLNEKTREFLLSGANIPGVPFDIWGSVCGLLPISLDPQESRKLYFWFMPSLHPLATDEITVWANGGPGSSSLEGLF
ncbi:carboxypeptidase D [[Emmonsia] crescens]|uniref:Carboxypeptidase D n=1 Tax=[Emmonsia] crescens TaxID=73230 RepID=A0A0G2HXF4_9EURO|nr:carboxypeptidase D [Emmonsia crescens UAMH 3008]